MPTYSELLGDRQYASQYSIPTLGIVIHKAGVPGDADGAVSVSMKSTDGVTTIFTRDADHPAVGVYEITISSIETSTPGVYQLIWSYQVDAVAQEFIGLIEVGPASPDYDALPDGFKSIVDSVWLRFSDLFDSPYGGPHLQVYYQTRWSRGRIAKLLPIAVGKLNNAAQPQTTYAVNGQFPFTSWGPLVDEALYIEAIKDLIRSYTEQPTADNVSLARQDRRDYTSRWQAVLELEMKDFEGMFEVFKIRHMGFGRPAVLVSGGVYGNFGPTRLPQSAAARPRYWFRYY
jgi:hypothetical protein